MSQLHHQHAMTVQVFVCVGILVVLEKQQYAQYRAQNKRQVPQKSRTNSIIDQ